MKLSPLERRVLQCHGVPARHVAVAERRTVHEILEIRAMLRERGIGPISPALQVDPPEEQLSLDQIDRMMRDNRAPQPTDSEIGWTTGTDLDGW